MAFQFGAGTLQVSGTAGVFSLAKLQNVNFTISYGVVAQLRGDRDIYPVNTQFGDGSCEGDAEYADIQLSALGLMIGGSGAFAGAAGSGTVTVTALSTPKRFQIRFSGVTNGITGVWTLDRVYFKNFELNFERTNYTTPKIEFVAEADPTAGNFMTWQQ